MPLTPSGKKVLTSMKKQYGDEKGEEVFYSSINAKKEGSEKWHEKRKRKRKNYSREAIMSAKRM